MATAPKSMCAVHLLGHGGPEMLEYRTDVPVPAPRAGEVLVRVGAAAVNNTDLWTREGAYNTLPGSSDAVGWQGEPLKFPRVQGADIAGTVVAVGAGVDESRVAERVVVDPIVRQREDKLFGAGIFGSERDGGFAQFTTCPAENAIVVDSKLSFVELASFPTAYLTAIHMLNRARLQAGEVLLVTGASGGVGTACVQLAKVRGARVIAIAGADKTTAVQALGADFVVSRSSDDIAAAIKAEIGETRIDVFADLVGGCAFAEILPLLHPEGGRYVVAGAIAGPVVQLDLRILYLNHLELIGSTIGTRDEFIEVLALANSGAIQPLVSRTFGLSEFKAAQQAFVEKGFVGKIVINLE